MSSNKLILSAYGSHNACISMFWKGRYWVVEVERWLNSKNQGLCNYMPARNMQLVFDEIVDYLLAQTDRSDVDVYLTGYMNDRYIKPKFAYKQLLGTDHHTAHAACTFFQSPYKEALVITCDGGGDNGYFNVYLANRATGIKLIDKFNKDLGFSYMILSDYLDDIKKESLTIGNLVYAGKLMGLCAYGKVREEWMPYFLEFYDKFEYSGSSYIGGAELRRDAVNALMSQIGVENFDFENTRFTGQFAWDLATTTQRAFEEIFLKYARKYLDEYKDLPLCLAGGCALNVLLNTRLAKERNGKVFIPPNTNDCGISVGQILWYLQPENQVDLTYSGLPLMDIDQLGTYLEDRAFTCIENISLSDLANYISIGYIVGFLQGNSEHGSRALGNRSILCNPGIKDMKDVLNEKVKHREFYRPFAPLLKIENVDTYFDFYGDDSRHMTFVADVKEEWKEKLPAITHEDGTGRLQTVTRWQNEAIYDLLTEFEKAAGHGVILNTSFNDNGKPILTRFSDALNLLRNTKLDAVYYHEKRLIMFKTGDEKRFIKSMSGEGTAQPIPETTVNVLAFAESMEEMTNKFLPTIKRMSSKTERLTVITSEVYAKMLGQSLVNSPNVRIYTIDKSKLYYNKMIQTKTAHFIYPDDKQSTHYFSLFVKPLWAKEVLRDNLFDTKYHLFIDLSLMDDYNYNIVRDLKVLSDLAKSDVLDSGSDTIMGMSTVKDRLTIFDNEFLAKRFNGFTPQQYPLPYIFYGTIDAIEWFSTNYEGQMRWYMDQDKVGVPADYCLLSHIENQHRYSFLELEKNEVVDE